MAVRFRNLQGGNPYQGLADTMERVSGRVGSAFMSYGNAVRQRNEKRDQYKAQKERSLVDNMIKLGVAAVGYENQQDALEYKKEQDKLNRQFREQESQRTADYRQSMLEEQVAGREQRGTYQQGMLERQDRLLEERIKGNEAQARMNEFMKKNTIELKKMQIGLNEKLLASKNQKTPLQEANSAAKAIKDLNLARRDLKSAEQIKWKLYTGQQIGVPGDADYIPENLDAQGRVTTTVGGEDRKVPMTFDNYLKNIGGYSGGLNAPSLKPIELEPYLLRFGSQAVKSILREDPSVIARIQDASKEKDEQLRDVANFMGLPTQDYGPKADPNAIPSVLAGTASDVTENPQEQDVSLEELSDVVDDGKINPEKAARNFANYSISNKGKQSFQDMVAENMVTEKVDGEEPDFMENKANAAPFDDELPVDTGLHTVTASELRVRSSPSAGNNDNIIELIPRDATVSVIGPGEGDYVEVQYNLEGQSGTGFVSKDYLEKVSDEELTEDNQTESENNAPVSVMDLSSKNIVKDDEKPKTDKETSNKVKKEVFNFTGNIADLLGERPKYNMKKIKVDGKNFLEISESVSGLKVREPMSVLGTSMTRDSVMLSLRTKIIQKYQKKK